jgi:hypothetical protein
MWNSRNLSCLLCAVCKSVFTDCRDISTLYYITCEIIWIYLVFCVLYVNESTDCRDISTLQYNSLNLELIELTKFFISTHYMWNSLDLSCLLCGVCKSVFTDCRDISTLYYITCEIVWIYLVFCVVYVNQSLPTVEIYRHSITLHVK